MILNSFSDLFFIYLFLLISFLCICLQKTFIATFWNQLIATGSLQAKYLTHDLKDLKNSLAGKNDVSL